jgi:hypothetical protein
VAFRQLSEFAGAALTVQPLYRKGFFLPGRDSNLAHQCDDALWPNKAHFDTIVHGPMTREPIRAGAIGANNDVPQLGAGHKRCLFATHCRQIFAPSCLAGRSAQYVLDLAGGAR